MSQSEIVAIIIASAILITATMYAFAGDDRQYEKIGEKIADSIQTKWFLRLLINSCRFAFIMLRGIALGSLFLVIAHPFIWAAMQLLNMIAASFLTGFYERASDRVWRMY